MNNKLWLIALLMINGAIAEVAVRDDGKRVELNADGSWEYISEDVLATSTSGLRVLLSPDGSWQSVVSKQKGMAAMASKSLEQSQFNDLVSLKSLEIQKVKESRASAKSTVFKHSMVARVVFETVPEKGLLTADHFTLTDNKGKDYPVISVRLSAQNIVTVRAEGAPDRWSRTKALALSVDKKLLATLSNVVLSVDFRDVKTKVYSEFTDE